MSLLDVILLIVIGGFTMFGFWFGLIHTLGSFMGTIVGAFIAGQTYESMGQWLVNITGWEANVSRILMFTIVFVVVNRLIGFVFWVVDRSVRVLTRLPFLVSINRFLGMVLGTFEGLVTIGLIIYFMSKFPVSPEIMMRIFDSSVAMASENAAHILLPFLPETLKAIQDSSFFFDPNLF